MNTVPDPGIFERGGSLLAVIYSILIFSLLMKLYEIIEPRLVKEGVETPSGSGPEHAVNCIL